MRMLRQVCSVFCRDRSSFEGLRSGRNWFDKLEAFDLAQLHGKLEHREDVFTFQVFVIGKNVVDGHACAEPFEHVFDRVTQASNARFAVADVRIKRDACASGHARDWSRRTRGQAEA